MGVAAASAPPPRPWSSSRHMAFPRAREDKKGPPSCFRSHGGPKPSGRGGEQRTANSQPQRLPRLAIPGPGYICLEITDGCRPSRTAPRQSQQFKEDVVEEFHGEPR